MFLIGFPLLLIPLAIFNIIVFLMPGVSMTSALNVVTLPSGASWQMSFADILIGLGLVLLIPEMAKAVRPGVKSIVDHGLALILFVVALAQFLLLEKFATSTYFALTLICFVDLVASIVVQSRRASAVRAASRATPAAVEAVRDTRAEAALLATQVQANVPAPVPGAVADHAQALSEHASDSGEKPAN